LVLFFKKEQRFFLEKEAKTFHPLAMSAMVQTAGGAGVVDDAAGSVTNRTAIGAGWLVAWRMVTRCLGIVSQLVLARILVPADFGLVAMATAFSAAIDTLSVLGLQDALVRHHDPDRALFDTAFTMQAIRGVLTGLVIAAGATWAGTWFGEPRLVPILLILAALAAIGGFENVGIVEFRRALRFSMEFRLLVLPRLCQFVLTILAAVLLRSYWALIIGIVAVKLLRVPLTYMVHPYRPRLTVARWRDLTGFTFWTWASGMATMVWDRSDSFILGPIIGSAGLGVYLLAGEIAVLPISELVAPATSALLAGFAAAQKKGTDTIGIALDIASTLLLLVLPLAVGFSATSGYIVAALLGPQWEAARPLIAIFAWLCAFSPFSFVCNSVLVARGLVRRNFFAVAISAAIKVVVVVLVARTGDLELIAMSSVACVGVESIAFILQLRGGGNARLREAAGGYVRIMLSAAVTLVLTRASGLGWQPVSLPAGAALVVGGAFGLAIIGVFATIQLVLWRLMGQPEGAESRLLGMGRGALARLLAWRRAPATG
jgi:O-antigen/teichoic acid export membrane protein